MKKTQLTLIILYLIITMYFSVFNWEIFVVSLNISLGFAVINVPLLIIISLSGLLFLLMQWGLVNINNLKTERDMARKDKEIMKLKAAQYDLQRTKIHNNAMSLKDLHGKVNKVIEKLDIELKETFKDQKDVEIKENVENSI